MAQNMTWSSWRRLHLSLMPSSDDCYDAVKSHKVSSVKYFVEIIHSINLHGIDAFPFENHYTLDH